MDPHTNVVVVTCVAIWTRPIECKLNWLDMIVCASPARREFFKYFDRFIEE